MISATMALWSGWNSTFSRWLVFTILVGDAAKTYIVIMVLLAWSSDVILVRWEVHRLIRMIVSGGAVGILTLGLERFDTMLLVMGLICGAVAALCVWLSASFEQDGLLW
ncbi:hypothetical protein J6500_13395 [Bradyrhizobium sp. WSM 1704]|uniref:hypothetical protein n=1 Tax=Bradyrhizobium semiaridum TaxID=2821404 RepID=UPI001CE3B296|nr:hypothetical protein [Bradyrhizobium semiaridum]MCA6122885.1 hypothetical protein [Bradyrhizobium semiaridum]